MQLAKVEGIETLDDTNKSEEIKLVQLALLLHASGANSDEEDLNNADSAINLYRYLTRRLNVPAEKTLTVANAI